MLASHDLFDLSGRVALVTGASSGLGRRFAQVLATRGAAVALVARRGDRLADLAAEITQAGGRAVPIAADIRDPVAITHAFDAAERALGSVDILINNAGVAHSNRAVEMPAEEWRRVLSTNLDAVFFASQEAARRLIAADKGGAIVNIASVLGFGVSRGTAAYAVAKAGVIQLTRALALELASKRIRVNAIAPGWIVTDLNRNYLASERGQAITKEIPLGRFGTEPDLDGPLLLLVSNAGRFMTGSTLVADGGQMVALRG